MTTELKKPVSRVTTGTHRGRQLVISLLPGDVIEIREKGRRTRETLSIGGAFDYAITTRVSRERFVKQQERKNARPRG